MQFEPFLYCGLAAVLILSLAWQPWRDSAPGDSQGWIANAIAWTAGTFLAVHAMKGRLPNFPPTEAEHFWAYAALLCLVPALLEARSWRVSTMLGGTIFAAFAWLASEPLRTSYWEGTEPWLQVGGATAVGALLFLLRPRPAAEWAEGPSYPGALALSTGCGAALLGQSYGGAAHVVGALAFFPAVVACIAMIRPRRCYWPGLAAAWTMGVPGLMVVGVWFAETPWSAALIIALSPQLVRLPLMRNRSRRERAVLHGALVVAAGALALWIGYEPASPYEGY